MMFGSIERTDRTGPTFSGAAELKIAQNRVMPPSTTSSYTTSAWSRPDCGRASGVFSIFTPSEERVAATSRRSGRPVNGATLTGFAVVVVVVERGAFVCAADPPPPPHAVRTRPESATTATTARPLARKVTSTPGP